MEDFQKWVCVYIANSPLEANLLRALLENKGINVNICALPSPRLHDYLHDKNEQVRVFIPETDYTRGKRYTEDLFANCIRQN